MVLEIITPEEQLFEGEVDAIQLPGTTGSFGVLNNHAPLVATLKEGHVKVKHANGGQEEQFSINGGVVEVLRNKVIVLAD